MVWLCFCDTWVFEAGEADVLAVDAAAELLGELAEVGVAVLDAVGDSDGVDPGRRDDDEVKGLDGSLGGSVGCARAIVPIPDRIITVHKKRVRRRIIRSQSSGVSWDIESF